jgi:EF hand
MEVIIMKHIGLCAALILAASGAAFAQTQTQPPGGNVPVAQGPCARGFDTAVKDGKMQLSAATLKAVDTNNDGRISRSEFDAACAKRLFDQAEGNKG